MQVAGADGQNIYRVARNKITESSVNGNIFKIKGRDYKLYIQTERVHGCGRYRRIAWDECCKQEPHDNEEDT